MPRTLALASVVALSLSLYGANTLAGEQQQGGKDAAADKEDEGPINPYEIIEADPALWNHGWAALGVGGALLIAGGITGGLALKWDKHLQRECDGDVCGPPHHDALDRRDRLATSSTVLLGAGVVAALTGILVLAVFAPDEEDAPPKVSLGPAAGPEYAGAHLTWRF